MQIEVGKLNFNVHTFTNLDLMDPIFRRNFDNGFWVSKYHVSFVEFVSLPQHSRIIKYKSSFMSLEGWKICRVVITMFLTSHGNNKSHVRSVKEDFF